MQFYHICYIGYVFVVQFFIFIFYFFLKGKKTNVEVSKTCV